MGTHHAPRGGGLVDDTAWVDPTAYISGSSTVGARSYLGAGVFVEANVTIGTDVIICDRIRVIADVPDNTTVECDCCSGSSGGGSEVLNFDSITTVGDKLDEYNTSGKLKGTLAYVGNDTFAGQSSVQDYFSLVYGEALTPDGITVVNSPTFGLDGAQWKRIGTTNPGWLTETEWYIDILGNDENTGTDPDHPLATAAEINRRWTGANFAFSVTVHQTSDLIDAEGGVLTNARTLNPSGRIVWIGEGDSEFTANLDSWIPQNNDDEYRVTATGIGTFDDGNRNIFKQGNNYAVANDSTLGVNVVTVTQPRNCDPLTGAAGTIQVFVEDEDISSVTLRNLPFWPFPAHGGQFVLSQIQMTGSPDRNLGASQVDVVCCRFQTPTFLGGNDCTIVTSSFFINATFKGGNNALVGSCAVNAEVTIEGGAVIDLHDNFSLHLGAVLHIEDGDVTNSADGQFLFGIFNVQGGVDAIRAENGGRYLGTGGTIYGSDNDCQWLNAENGSQCGLGNVVGATLQAQPLTVASVTHVLADVPISNTTVFAGIRN